MNWEITDSIMLTMSDDDINALLTVRGKDHDINLDTMYKMRDVLNEAIMTAEARRAAL